MTQNGGAHGDGRIFSIDTNGTGYTNLLDFTGSNGSGPTGELVLSGKTLYGVTEHGGANSDGRVFSIDTNGNNYKGLIDFNNSTGSLPWGTLTVSISGKVLYGVTELGALYGSGRIFSIDTNGTSYKDLFDFNGSNGSDAEGSLILSGDLLYGTTYNGGSHNEGVLYSIDTNGSNYDTLLNFNGTKGTYPEGIIFSGDVLFGVTRAGGANNKGVIYSINTNGTGYSDLFNFNSSTGSTPYAPFIKSGNALYGVTSSGGLNGDGVVYRFSDKTLGVNEVSETKGSINVYPNPSNGNVTIQSSLRGTKQSPQTIEVYNMLGEQIKQLSMVNSKLSIDLSSQPNGIYLYRVIANSGELIGDGKLVKETNSA